MKKLQVVLEEKGASFIIILSDNLSDNLLHVQLKMMKRLIEMVRLLRHFK